LYVPNSELFDALQTTQLSIGHGGRDRMTKGLGNKYKNITRTDIEAFLRFCEPCKTKTKKLEKKEQ